jgi:hypothetical protein
VTNDPIIILRDKDGQRVLPSGWRHEANAIGLQIENVAPGAPMTHDLLRDVIQASTARWTRWSSATEEEHLLRADSPDRPRRAGHDRLAPERCHRLALRPAPDLRRGHVSKAPQPSSPHRADEHERLQKWLESLDADDLGKYKM